jgi:hypothetical protein
MSSYITNVPPLSAKGAVSYQPGATPQDSCRKKTPSAETANHSMALNRAFSAGDAWHQGPGAMPQASNEVAPLALNMDIKASRISP